MRERTILHCDMDAFFAAVEQRERNLVGTPVIVGSSPDKRGVVAAASYEARKFGIHSAMASSEAQRLCPEAVFISPDKELYSSVSKAIFEIFRNYTPTIEPISIDEAFLDVTGSLGHWESELELAKSLQNEIFDKLQLTSSIGIANNMFLAKVASDINKPFGITTVPIDQLAITNFLAPMAIRKIWGIGQKTANELIKFNIKLISDIQALREESLGAIIGNNRAKTLHGFAFGRDDRQVQQSLSQDKSISHETTFEEDISCRDTLFSVLDQLTDKCCRRLRQQNLFYKTLRIKIRYGNFKTLNRQITLQHGESATIKTQQLCRTLFDKHYNGEGIRLIGVALANLSTSSGAKQDSLFEIEEDKRKQKKLSHLDVVMDEIRHRLGSSSIGFNKQKK